MNPPSAPEGNFEFPAWGGTFLALISSNLALDGPFPSNSFFEEPAEVYRTFGEKRKADYAVADRWLASEVQRSSGFGYAQIAFACASSECLDASYGRQFRYEPLEDVEVDGVWGREGPFSRPCWVICAGPEPVVVSHPFEAQIIYNLAAAGLLTSEVFTRIMGFPAHGLPGDSGGPPQRTHFAAISRCPADQPCVACEASFKAGLGDETGAAKRAYERDREVWRAEVGPENDSEPGGVDHH